MRRERCILNIRLSDRELRLHDSRFPTINWYIAPSDWQRQRKKVGTTRSRCEDKRNRRWWFSRNPGFENPKHNAFGSRPVYYRRYDGAQRKMALKEIVGQGLKFGNCWWISGEEIPRRCCIWLMRDLQTIHKKLGLWALPAVHAFLTYTILDDDPALWWFAGCTMRTMTKVLKIHVWRVILLCSSDAL